MEVADLLLQIRISNWHRKVIPFVFILGRLAGNKKLLSSLCGLGFD